MKNLKNKAFTLIETLVALVIGMIAIGAMYFAYQYFNNTYQSITDRAAMSEAGRNSLSLIAKDLRKNLKNTQVHQTQYLYHLALQECILYILQLD